MITKLPVQKVCDSARKLPSSQNLNLKFLERLLITSPRKKVTMNTENETNPNEASQSNQTDAKKTKLEKSIQSATLSTDHNNSFKTCGIWYILDLIWNCFGIFSISMSYYCLASLFQTYMPYIFFPNWFCISALM